MLGSCGIVASSLLLWGGGGGGSSPPYISAPVQANCAKKFVDNPRPDTPTLYHPTPSVYSQLLTSLLLLWGPSPPLSKHLAWVALPQNKIPLPMNKRANCLCGKHDLRTLIVAHTTGFSTATYPGYFLLLTAPIHAVTAFANGQRVSVELQR